MVDSAGSTAGGLRNAYAAPPSNSKPAAASAQRRPVRATGKPSGAALASAEVRPSAATLVSAPGRDDSPVRSRSPSAAPASSPALGGGVSDTAPTRPSLNGAAASIATGT